MARFGTLGGGAAISDAELDDMIADADPKSPQAQQQQTVQVQQQRAVVSAAQVAAARRRAFITGGAIVGVGLLAYFHFRDK